MKNNIILTIKRILPLSISGKAFRRIPKPFLALLLLFSFSGCDFLDPMEDLDKGKHKHNEQLFLAELHPLNNSGVTGKATFKYEEGSLFMVEVNAKGLVPNQEHPQHVHTKGECPPESDGLIGHDEIEHFVGEELIPLDDDLVPLSAGEFPMANDAGKISYAQWTRLEDLISALDEELSGNQTLENLDLDHRVVVLHGAYVKDGQIVAPGTEGAEYRKELPVACGKIKKAGGHHD